MGFPAVLSYFEWREVLFLVFASFTSAYLVMGSRLPLRALIEKVYRGLFLADGEGLDVMEGEDAGGLQPNNLDTYLTLLSTFIVTICLLNVSIAAPRKQRSARALGCGCLEPSWIDTDLYVYIIYRPYSL